jgi:hypothetical protein
MSAVPRLDALDPHPLCPLPTRQKKTPPDDMPGFGFAPISCGCACYGRPPGRFACINLLKVGDHTSSDPNFHSTLPATQSGGNSRCLIITITLDILGWAANMAFGVQRIEAIQHHGPRITLSL